MDYLLTSELLETIWAASTCS